jgi:hypothetical protein
MAMRRDRWRVGAASATLSAGALVFFAAGTGPASAEPSAVTAGATDCKLGPLLCGLLGAGKSTPTPSPTKSSEGGGTSTKPTGGTKPAAKPRPKPKPAAKPAPARHGGGVAGPAGAPPALPAGAAPEVPIPDSSQSPALPDVADQYPVVVPEAAPGAPAPRARLVADSATEEQAVPPLLVATASGLIGAVAALNLSLARRRRTD